MKVIITKKHCTLDNYENSYDCPLYRAIKDQYPEFPLEGINGFGEIATTDNTKWEYSPAHGWEYPQPLDKGKVWNTDTSRELFNGEIDEFVVTLQKLL